MSHEVAARMPCIIATSGHKLPFKMTITADLAWMAVNSAITIASHVQCIPAQECWISSFVCIWHSHVLRWCSGHGPYWAVFKSAVTGEDCMRNKSLPHMNEVLTRTGLGNVLVIWLNCSAMLITTFPPNECPTSTSGKSLICLRSVRMSLADVTTVWGSPGRLPKAADSPWHLKSTTNTCHAGKPCRSTNLVWRSVLQYWEVVPQYWCHNTKAAIRLPNDLDNCGHVFGWHIWVVHSFPESKMRQWYSVVTTVHFYLPSLFLWRDSRTVIAGLSLCSEKHYVAASQYQDVYPYQFRRVYQLSWAISVLISDLDLSIMDAKLPELFCVQRRSCSSWNLGYHGLRHK